VKEDAVATPGVRAAIHSSASGDEAGGDLYYFSVCAYDTLTRIAVADVRGHGAPVRHLSEWLYTALERRMNEADGAAVLTDLNEIVRKRGFEALTTAVVATLDRDRRTAAYAYAGHPPALLWRAGQGWRTLDVRAAEGPANLPLGVLSGARYTQQKVPVLPGDRLFLYTDGVSECPGPSGALFGDAALGAALEQMSDAPLGQARDALRQELVSYSGEALTHDDCTFLLVETLPAPPVWKRRWLPGRPPVASR
jgi:sigma-B regulation protein RsbU (phosphoserine phosphatase)